MRVHERLQSREVPAGNVRANAGPRTLSTGSQPARQLEVPAPVDAGPSVDRRERPCRGEGAPAPRCGRRWSPGHRGDLDPVLGRPAPEATHGRPPSRPDADRFGRRDVFLDGVRRPARRQLRGRQDAVHVSDRTPDGNAQLDRRHRAMMASARHTDVTTPIVRDYASAVEHARAVITAAASAGRPSPITSPNAAGPTSFWSTARQLTSGLHVPLRRARRSAPRHRDADPDDDVRLGAYRRLAAETGTDPSWHEVGSMRLASSTERLEELGAAPAGPRPSACLWSSSTAKEAQDRFPLMSTEGVLGGVWLPTGWLARPPRGWPMRSRPARGNAASRSAPARGSWRRDGTRPRDQCHRRPQGRTVGDPHRGRRQRRRDVRTRDRADGRRHRADHPDGPPIPLHRAA